MSDILYFVAAYGLCFGLMNDKAAVGRALRRRVAFFDQMFECAYCTGFHCGWFVWVLRGFAVGFPSDMVSSVAQLVVWGFAGAASCYALDVGLKWLETPVSPEGK